MRFLYQLGIPLYGALIRVASLFLPKAREWVQGRRHWPQKVAAARQANATTIWLHCSSVGEFEDSRVVWEALQKAYPQANFVLSFFSASGYNHLKDRGVAQHVLYLPLDTRANARKFLDLLQPDLVFFSRSDLWINILSEVNRRGIPSYLLGLRLDENSKFLNGWVRGLFSTGLATFSHLYVQNETTQTLLKEHFGVSAVTVVGNARIDRIALAAGSRPTFERVEAFAQDHFTVIIGSALDTEEVQVIQLMQDPALADVRWILVPHEIHQDQLQARAVQFADIELLFTQDTPIGESHRVLWIDTVGHLKHLYPYADMAVVGGGFDRIGIHSILEPAVHGLPIWFGPNHRDYPEALDLLALGGASLYHSAEDLKTAILKAKEEGIPPALTEKIRGYVTANTGASEQILADLKARQARLS